ncbi:hypothetical protein ONZ45_g14754 [Pleurotus djamor]|nr:hypothetical protein ONZ45_g14754 [Pleurotus djamor]
MSPSLCVVVLATFLGLVAAVPLLQTRQSVSVLSSSQIAAFKPYTYYASSAYCQPQTTQSWTCGTNCMNNADFIPVASGGDGKAIQFWYVGYDPNLDTIIVAHQGTDTSKLTSILVNANVALNPLDQTLFPGIPEDVNVHGGFAEAHARAAPDILAAVINALSSFFTKDITLVGHSLGGALALLDAVYLPFHLPSDTTFKVITYGMPRVGNTAFADYVDKNIPSLTRINYK